MWHGSQSGRSALLGLRRPEAERGGELDHPVVLLGDQAPLNGPSDGGSRKPFRPTSGTTRTNTLGAQIIRPPAETCLFDAIPKSAVGAYLV
jgi:hypothetical protein